MDPRSTAQDVHRCDLCETAIVHSYCDFCNVNLCKLCIGEHITDGYEKHKIVPFQKRRSTLIYPKCEMHPQKNCKFQCKDCNNIVICSSCAVSKQHKGHDVLEVTEVFNKKKEVLRKDTQDLEHHIFPTYDEIALDLENQLASLHGEYEKLTTTISKQGEQWHREIDIVINKTKTEINEIELKHKEILQKHLDEIKQIQSLVKQTLLALKEKENSNEVSPIIEYSSKIRKFCKLPPRILVTLPTFIPKPIDREKLISLFGHITPLSTSAKEHFLSLIQLNVSVRKLLDEPEILTTTKTGFYGLRSVICLNEDRIWTSGWNNDINCYNIKGSLLRTLKTESVRFPIDIAVDSDRTILYINRESKTVDTVMNGEIKELIKMQEWEPNAMCITSNGDLLVSMNSDNETSSRVVRYSGYKETQTIQFDNKGNHLYSAGNVMKYITENKNHDICVADRNAGAVVVVYQDGEFSWRYTGYYSSVTEMKSFKPFGITTDSQSQILVADTNRNCIHILDENGQFFRYIDICDPKIPWGVCVDKNDNLFVCVGDYGNVKKIKYLH